MGLFIYTLVVILCAGMLWDMLSDIFRKRENPTKEPKHIIKYSTERYLP